MTTAGFRPSRRAPAFGALALSATLAVASLTVGSASATTPTAIGLGTAGAASVLAGSGVTNTGSSILGLDLDTWPTPAVSGFPPGLVLGTQHAADAVAQLAQGDLTTAYNQAASAPSTMNETGVDLGGQTLTEGVYTASTAMSLTGSVPLTLNGSASSVFIFQAGTTLITGSNSSVVLTGGVSACNIFWQVGSSATLGTNTAFIGTILALQSISVDTGATVQGRALARNGAVTLDDNVFSGSSCAASTPSTTTTSTVAPTTVAPTTVAPITAGPNSTVAAGTTTATTGAGSTTATTAGTGGGGATLIEAGGTTPTGPLAATGLDVRPLLALASVLLLAGTVVVTAARRVRR